jgi:hypothetical protein
LAYTFRLVKLLQSNDCRRAKQLALLSLGFNKLEARRFRDWRQTELISLVRVYFYSIGRDPQEAEDILLSHIKGLEDPDLSLVN